MRKSVHKILFLLFLGFLFIVGGFISSFTIKPSSVLYGLGVEVKRQISSFLFFDTLAKENEKLKSEYARLLNVLVENKRLTSENRELKEALGYKDDPDNIMIFTKVAARIKKGGEDILVIDRGKNDGIMDNLLVTDKNKYLLGRILKAENSYSIVRMINSPYFKISFKKPDNEEVMGILRGNLSFSLESDMVPRDASIDKEDIVVTTNLNQDVEDIIIGRVSYTEDDENLVFKKVFVSPLADIENLRFLFVVKPLNNI